jgi:hypothetical protein
MSLNITPLTEVNKTLLGGVRISMSTADLIVGFPIEAPDGSTASPSYSFSTNLNTGLARASTGVSAVVDAEVGMVAGVNSNVGIGAVPTDYGGGAGVLFLADAAVDPIGAPGSAGGILYVSGTDLVYLNAAGVTVTLTSAGGSDVLGPSSSTDEEVAKYADATGDIITNSGVVYSGAQLRVGDGTAAVPAYAFTSDPGTGMYLSGPNYVFGAAGTPAMTLSAASTTLGVPLTSIDGSAGAPALSFTSNGTSGLYGDGAAVGLSSGGVGGVRSGGYRNTVLADGSFSGMGTAATGVVKIVTATTNPVGVPNGGSGGILFVTGAGTQLRWLDASGTDVLVGGNLAVAGAAADNQMLVWGDATGTTLTASSAVVTDAGGIAAVQSATLTNPAYSFTGDTTTGMARAAAGTLRVVVAAATLADLDASTWKFSQATLFNRPSGVPAMSFSADASTGMFTTGNNYTRVKINDSTVAQFDETYNILTGTGGSQFAAGVGVWAIADAITNPSTAPVGGGFLYVDGTNLLWRNTDNAEVNITTAHTVASITSSTDSAIARFDGTTGVVVQDSAVFISGAGQITAVAAEGYRFASSITSGLFSGGANTLSLASAGTTGFTGAASTLTVAPGHVLSGTVGSAAAPAITFASDPDTGMYLAAPNTTSVSVGGVRAITAAPNNNIAFGADTPDFAGGQGVVYFSDVTTLPSGALTNGGLLYVSGRDLYFHDKDGAQSKLTGVWNAAGSSTDNAVVRFSGTTGRNIIDTSAVTITDANQMLVPDGTPLTPAYTLSEGGATGMSLNAGTLQIGNGATQLSVSAAAIVSSVATSANSGMRVGGLGGMTETFSTPTSTRNIANASGTFVWAQDGATIMQSDTNNNVDLMDHNVGFTGATGALTIQHDGASSYEFLVASTADSLSFRVGAADVLTVANGPAITMNNLEVQKGEVYADTVTAGYGFTASPGTAGMQYTPTSGSCVVANSHIGWSAFDSTNMGLFTNSRPPFAARTVTILQADTAPTALPPSGVYMYIAGTSEFFRIANENKDVAANGPNARAKFTRTAAINAASDTLIDTLVDVESHILVVDTAAPGAGTVTGTGDTAGWWEVAAEARWASNAVGYRKVRVLIDGVEVAIATQNAVTTGGVETQQQATACVNVAANAVMTVRVEQTSGGVLNVDITATVVLLG